MTEAVGVIGGGTMGVGIAYVSAIAGYDVHVAEPDDAQAAAMVQTIATTLDGAVARGKLSGDAREAAAASIHRVAAINTAWGHDPHRWSMGLEMADLHR